MPGLALFGRAPRRWPRRPSRERWGCPGRRCRAALSGTRRGGSRGGRAGSVGAARAGDAGLALFGHAPAAAAGGSGPGPLGRRPGIAGLALFGQAPAAVAESRAERDRFGLPGPGIAGLALFGHAPAAVAEEAEPGALGLPRPGIAGLALSGTRPRRRPRRRSRERWGCPGRASPGWRCSGTRPRRWPRRPSRERWGCPGRGSRDFSTGNSSFSVPTDGNYSYVDPYVSFDWATPSALPTHAGNYSHVDPHVSFNWATPSASRTPTHGNYVDPGDGNYSYVDYASDWATPSASDPFDGSSYRPRRRQLQLRRLRHLTTGRHLLRPTRSTSSAGRDGYGEKLPCGDNGLYMAGAAGSFGGSRRREASHLTGTQAISLGVPWAGRIARFAVPRWAGDQEPQFCGSIAGRLESSNQGRIEPRAGGHGGVAAERPKRAIATASNARPTQRRSARLHSMIREGILVSWKLRSHCSS